MLSASPLKIHEPLVTGVSPRPTDRRRRQKLRNTSDHGQPHHALAGVGALLPAQQLLPSVQSQPGTRTRHTRDGDPDAISAVSGTPVPAPSTAQPGLPASDVLLAGRSKGRLRYRSSAIFCRPGHLSAAPDKPSHVPRTESAKQACTPFRMRTDRPRLSEGQAVPDGRRPVVGIARAVGRVHAGSAACGGDSGRAAVAWSAGRDPRRHQRAAFGGSAWLRPPVSAMR